VLVPVKADELPEIFGKPTFYKGVDKGLIRHIALIGFYFNIVQ
jgi:hypothetical protein